MKNSLYSIGIVLIVLSLTLTSCTQDTINKLQGKWTVIPIGDINTTDVETWEFTSDGVLLVTNTSSTYGNQSGKYVVEAGFLDTKLTISEFPNQYNFYNAEWKIIDLKNNTLYINNDKEGGLYTKEFER